MNKKRLISDIVEIFIWVFLFACVIGGSYFIWHYGWKR